MRKPNNLVHKKTNVSDFSCCGWQLSPIDFDDVISSRLVAHRVAWKRPLVTCMATIRNLVSSIKVHSLYNSGGCGAFDCLRWCWVIIALQCEHPDASWRSKENRFPHKQFAMHHFSLLFFQTRNPWPLSSIGLPIAGAASISPLSSYLLKQTGLGETWMT